MILAAFAAAFFLAKASPSVVLERGAVARGVPIWDVEDTTLDAKAPNESKGGETTLEGGPLKTILIRFGDLDRVVAPGQRVTKATLVLTSEGADPVKLRSVSRVLAPWGEGPYISLSATIFKVRPAAAANGKPVEEAAPIGAATWRQRRGGDAGIAWQEPGAQGSRDSAQIDTAHVVAKASETRIEGLEAAVQAMVDRPYDNFGFALAFDASVEFSSSQSDRNRPRLELETEDIAPPHGPDLSVVAIERLGADGKLPAEGATATLTAHVKNVGDAPAQPFDTVWTIDEHEGTFENIAKSLAPGQETTVSYQVPYHPDKTDHRWHTAMLRIRPTGPDASARNDALRVYRSGRPIEVVLSPSAAAILAAQVNRRGSKSPEDWVQGQVETFNEVYLAQSHFSFAPDGVRERVAVQRVVVGDTKTDVPAADGATRVELQPDGSGADALSVTAMKNLGLAAGLFERSASNPAADKNELDGRGSLDRFPGLMGYGDTRFDGFAPGEIELPYEPFFSPIFEGAQLEATGLLAATDVATLNAALGDPPVALPHSVLLRTFYQTNLPIPNAKLDFFQARQGRIAKDATPDFSVTADEKGTVILPDRPNGLFGTLDPSYSNGAFLVRATANGASSSTWFKAWQATDTVSRGNRAARSVALMDLHFVLPTDPLDMGTNLTADRIVTDSTGALPAKLGALIDDSNDTEATLGDKKDDWVEIDLGRDRTVGEVDLVADPKGAFWQKFEMMAYITGQKPDEATPWVREIDWNWTSQNRFEKVAPNRILVRYRGNALRFRYLRIVNRSGGEGRLAEIRVIPAKVAP